jgi:hypothetical protein
MGWHKDDLTVRTGSPLAVFGPAAYVFAQNTQHVVYQGFTPAGGNDGHLYELYWTQDGGWHFKDLTAEAQAPLCTSYPTAYAFEATGTQHVLYEGQYYDGHVHELWWDSDGWHHNDLTDATGAPLSSGVPAGYEFPGDGTQHVVYTGRDSHIHALGWDPSGWHHLDLTAKTSAPLVMAGGVPSAYVFKAELTQHVLYQGEDSHVHELWRDSTGWHHNDLTLAASAPLTSADPTGYVFESQGTQHVNYRGPDGHIHELWADSHGWHHFDLTTATGAPLAAVEPVPRGYGFDSQIAQPVATQHVDYVSPDGHIHELWWDTSGWHHNDLTATIGAPSTIGGPAAYMFPAEGTQHVIYNAEDSHHIIELYWKL